MHNKVHVQMSTQNNAHSTCRGSKILKNENRVVICKIHMWLGWKDTWGRETHACTLFV